MQTGTLEVGSPDKGNVSRLIRGASQELAKEKHYSEVGHSIGLDCAYEASEAGLGCLSYCFAFALCLCGLNSMPGTRVRVMICDAHTSTVHVLPCFGVSQGVMHCCHRCTLQQ